VVHEVTLSMGGFGKRQGEKGVDDGGGCAFDLLKKRGTVQDPNFVARR
jgi:hypothetical protein